MAAMADEGRVAAVAARGTVTPWSAHIGTVKHFRGNVLTAGEGVKQDPAFTAVAVSRPRHHRGGGVKAVPRTAAGFRSSVGC